MAMFYNIICWSTVTREIFIKIGVTRHDTLFQRYNSPIAMPYAYKILATRRGTMQEMRSLESKVSESIREHNYTPMMPFSGSKTECFTTAPYRKYQYKRLFEEIRQVERMLY